MQSDHEPLSTALDVEAERRVSACEQLLRAPEPQLLYRRAVDSTNDIVRAKSGLVSRSSRMHFVNDKLAGCRNEPKTHATLVEGWKSISKVCVGFEN